MHISMQLCQFAGKRSDLISRNASGYAENDCFSLQHVLTALCQFAVFFIVGNFCHGVVLVHQNNLLGEPVACIPYLGYFAAWVQNPPGSLIAIGAGVFLLALVFLPDLLGGNKEKKKTDASGDEKDTSPNT